MKSRLAGVNLDYPTMKTLKDKVKGKLSATAEVAEYYWLNNAFTDGPVAQWNEAGCTDTPCFKAKKIKSPASRNSSHTWQEHTWMVHDMHQICYQAGMVTKPATHNIKWYFVRFRFELWDCNTPLALASPAGSRWDCSLPEQMKVHEWQFSHWLTRGLGCGSKGRQAEEFTVSWSTPWRLMLAQREWLLNNLTEINTPSETHWWKIQPVKCARRDLRCISFCLRKGSSPELLDNLISVPPDMDIFSVCFITTSETC